MWFNLSVILILSIIITAFAVANSAPVIVNLIFWQSQQMSLSIVILVSVLIGFSFAGILALYQKIKDSLKIRNLESRIRKLSDLPLE
ncbi:MAG: LapA family protein [Candidatus Margulisiibacteriota bacterium]